MNKMQEIINICDIHIDRINISIKHIERFFPINAELVKKLDIKDLVWFELLVSRFGKLQDLLGKKINRYFLESQKEDIHSLTVLDKLNKLERFGIIENSELWSEMRRIRNHISDEYPEEPILMARYLNQIYDLTPKLIDAFTESRNYYRKTTFKISKV